METRPVIIAGVRTAFGKFGGRLRDVPVVTLGVQVICGALQRARLQPADIGCVVMGQSMPNMAGMTPTRQAVLEAGLSETTRSLSIDRACCSGLTAISLLAKDILLGDETLGIAGGMENLSQTPYMLPQLRWGQRLGDLAVEDHLFMRNPTLQLPRVVYVAEAALKHGEGREQQDRWALRSHQRWAEAVNTGWLSEEILPLDLGLQSGVSEPFEVDEQGRPDTSLEKLAALPTVYGSATITAGNAPGLNDGAAAVVMSSMREAKQRGLPVMAEVVSYAAISGNPRLSAELPAQAILGALDKAHVSLKEVALLEINEAYAAVPLVSTRILSEATGVDPEKLRSRTNVNGGSVAIGHPVAATGTRLVLTLVLELRRRGGGFGVVGICGGIGQSDAMLIHVPN